MNQIEDTAVLVQRKCGEFAELLKDQKWGQLDSNAFENACQTAIGELTQIQQSLKDLQGRLKFESFETETDVKKKNQELFVLVRQLHKNLELEQKKVPSKLADFDFMPKSQSFNEQFSFLQHQIANALLQTTYTMEKLLLETKKEGFSPATEKTTSHALLELLKMRETEISEMKKDYSQIRRESLIGPTESVADQESELQQTSQKISVHQHRLEQALKNYGQITEKMFTGSQQLNAEIAALQQLVWNHFQKSQEIVTQLKKERDLARQLALDTETQTVGLRSQYSRELLGFQEKIVHAKNQTRKEFQTRIEKLENELNHKNSLLSHFKETTNQLQKRARELEEKNMHLQLLFKTREKHEKIKKAFKQTKKTKTTE